MGPSLLNTLGKIESYSLMAGGNLELNDSESHDFSILLNVDSIKDSKMTYQNNRILVWTGGAEGGYGWDSDGGNFTIETDIYARIFFSDTRNLPEPTTFAGSMDGASFYVKHSLYLPTRYFEIYLDILRNESPLYLHSSCEIVEDTSVFLNEESNGIRQSQEIELNSKNNKMASHTKTSIYINTEEEPVGEGESKSTIIINQ